MWIQTQQRSGGESDSGAIALGSDVSAGLTPTKRSPSHDVFDDDDYRLRMCAGNGKTQSINQSVTGFETASQSARVRYSAYEHVINHISVATDRFDA